MLVEIQNNSESTLVINYENRIYRFEGNQKGALEVASLDFELSAHMELIEFLDLELQEKTVKNKLFQRIFDKFFSFAKKFMVNCKNTYRVKLNEPTACLEFCFATFGKDSGFAEEYLDMPLEVSGFARLECNNAQIEIVDSEAINKKDFLRVYRRTYLFVNWEMGLLCLFAYLPSCIKQKKMVSGVHLRKVFKNFYSCSREQRDEMIKIKDNE